MTIQRSIVLDDVLEPLVRCFTPEVAQRIASLQPEESMQKRVDELAAKASEGSLTDAEKAEYGEYIDAADIIGILQAKARHVLQVLPLDGRRSSTRGSFASGRSL